MKWGIIGAGRIAHRFCNALKMVNDCELYAVACRTQDKADVFKELHPCMKAYAGFENIVNDDEIDAVYIATPHPYHYEWIMKCLKAHKAVLVEKPACMNVEEINDVIECAKENNTLFMEAMKTRFVPLYKEIKNRIHKDEIGGITSIYASLCNEIPQQAIDGSYLGNPTSGGVLTDTGIYPISWIEDYCKEDYCLNHLYTNIKDNVNYYTRADMSFGKVDVMIECAMDRNKGRKTIIQGTKGKIVVEDMHRPTTVFINDVEIDMPYEVDDMFSQILHFVDLYNKNKIESDIMSFESSKRCAQIMYTITEGMDWTEETVKLLNQQEKDLRFKEISDEDIQNIGKLLIMNQVNYERNAAIRIYDEVNNRVVFEYLPEDKSQRNFDFMEGKRNVSKYTKHSSLYAVVKNVVFDVYQEIMNDFPTYCPSGGSFPIIVNDVWKYTVLTSGLHEGEDHELIVNALYDYKHIPIPKFPYHMI